MTNKYKIIQTRDPRIIKYMIPGIEKVVEKGKTDYTAEQFIHWFFAGIKNPMVRTWVVLENGNRFIKDDTKLVGSAIAQIVFNLSELCVSLSHIYSTDKKVSQALQKEVETWTKENGIHRIISEVRRCPKAWERSFGFKQVAWLISKEV